MVFVSRLTAGCTSSLPSLLPSPPSNSTHTLLPASPLSPSSHPAQLNKTCPIDEMPSPSPTPLPASEFPEWAVVMEGIIASNWSEAGFFSEWTRDRAPCSWDP